GLEARAQWQRDSGLDPRTFSLVKIDALVAVDAPPASYLWQISNALDSGATPREIVGVLRAIAPQVGGPRCIAAAPEILVALRLGPPGDRPEVLGGAGPVPARGGGLAVRFMRRRPLLRAAAFGGGAYLAGKRVA